MTIEQTAGYEIEVKSHTYDGPRRPHTQFFFHVKLNGVFLQSFKRRKLAEEFIEIEEQERAIDADEHWRMDVGA